ncbi:MAG TPA: hypothetical protein VH643_24105 [Gemmataceae bacterium]|jgi:hypothetical protein
MSEPFAKRLSRFTPEAAGLDRDALLFAAGRASVRPNPLWKALVAVLVALQLLTLVWSLLPSLPPSSPPAPPLVSPNIPPPIAASETDLIGDTQAVDMYDGLLSRNLDRPVLIGSEMLVPPAPPLRAFGTPPSTILN